MKQIGFRTLTLLSGALVLLAVFNFASAQSPVSAGAFPAYQSDVFITVIYEEPINVRNGPSTVLYDIVGTLSPGATAPALGLSPGQEWVKIAFPNAPGGVGWVYIPNHVTLSPGNLPIVEPPPTSAPLTTATIDPTLAAAYAFEPTSTRLPTFTPAPMVTVPRFTEEVQVESGNGFPMGYLVLGLGIPGLLGYLFSTVRRH